MQNFNYPVMPMYSHDHGAYMRSMHDWHMSMAQYHEQQRAFHNDRARHFQQMMGRLNVAVNIPLEEQSGHGAA